MPDTLLLAAHLHWRPSAHSSVSRAAPLSLPAGTAANAPPGPQTTQPAGLVR